MQLDAGGDVECRASAVRMPTSTGFGVKSSTSVALRAESPDPPDEPPQPATIAAVAINVMSVTSERRTRGAA